MLYKKMFGNEWYENLKEVIESNYWTNLGKFIASERGGWNPIYPPKNSNTFMKAFRTTPISEIKCIILGREPYNDGSFDGFAFSNNNKSKLSNSLVNIFKEIENDCYNGLQIDQNPYLKRWAEQGVLLINIAHTSKDGFSNVYLDNYLKFTKKVIDSLLKIKDRPIVWMLWGDKVQNVFKDIKYNNNHLVLLSSCPNSYSENNKFLGCKHFSKCNSFLKKNNIKKIIW